MKKYIFFIILLLTTLTGSAGFLALLPQLAGISPVHAADPEAAGQTRPELTTDYILRFNYNSEVRDFSTGTEEEAYIRAAARDNEDLPRQGRFPGINDAIFEQLVFNKRFFMGKTPQEAEESGDDEYPYPGMGNPDVWMLSVHYPQQTGHAAVDAFLKQQAKRFFMQNLSVDPEKIPALNPEEWLAAQRFSKDEDGKQLLAESFAATRRFALNGGGRPQTGDPALYYRHHGVVTYTLTRPSARYLSVVFTTESYWGGAHNNWKSEVFSFDLNTGKLLQAGDLFTGTAKQLARLKKRLGELAAQAGVEDYDSLPKAFQAIVDDPKKIPLGRQKFALTRDGLVFIYDPYEIASYSQGTILLTVPVKELKSCGVNTRFWQ